MANTHPDEIRTRFSRAMSDMYRAEVPQYGTLMKLVADVNEETLTKDSELWRRSDASLRLGLAIALVYCLVAETVMIGFAREIALIFVDDLTVAGAVARIMPVMMFMYFAAGPMMMIASYFQTIGDAGRAAILGLSKLYLFTIPLIFALSFVLGEQGIWLASPAAEILLITLRRRKPQVRILSGAPTPPKNQAFESGRSGVVLLRASIDSGLSEVHALGPESPDVAAC